MHTGLMEFNDRIKSSLRAALLTDTRNYRSSLFPLLTIVLGFQRKRFRRGRRAVARDTSRRSFLRIDCFCLIIISRSILRKPRCGIQLAPAVAHCASRARADYNRKKIYASAVARGITLLRALRFASAIELINSFGYDRTSHVTRSSNSRVMI